MAILSAQVLSDFYHNGFCTADRNAEFVKRAPERLIPLGAVDPRMPGAVEEIERQVTELGMQGFKSYTAEWRGESRGRRANDPEVFPLYEKCIELGIKNMHFHKGPAVEPLALEKFDVRHIDEPSTLYPELNFIVDHVGLPRLDDFCWLAARSPNVYGSLAARTPSCTTGRATSRPRWPTSSSGWAPSGSSTARTSRSGTRSGSSTTS
jgi:predicted TIM-barrel fold metal-dependent hydrolase